MYRVARSRLTHFKWSQIIYGNREKYAKPSINTSKYAIYYPQITSLFSEHQADGLRLHQCIVASVSASCRTRASVGPKQ